MVDIFKKIGEFGLFGILFLEEYGGVGGDIILYVIVVEEIGKVCGSMGLSYVVVVLFGVSLLYYFGIE